MTVSILTSFSLSQTTFSFPSSAILAPSSFWHIITWSAAMPLSWSTVHGSAPCPLSWTRPQVSFGSAERRRRRLSRGRVRSGEMPIHSAFFAAGMTGKPGKPPAVAM